MLALCTWSRSLIVAMLLLISSQYVLAQKSETRLPVQTTEATAKEGSPRAGSPELGVLIIIGVVGLLILIAWIYSRIGEGSGRQSDNGMN